MKRNKLFNTNYQVDFFFYHSHFGNINRVELDEILIHRLLKITFTQRMSENKK